MGITLASDVGGTFTDVVLTATDGRVQVAKTLTTPDDPTVGLMRGVEQVLAGTGVEPGQVDRFVHATTLATNVILERTGVPVAFITTEGFRSMLALGRQARVEEERYDLAYERPEPPVPLSHTFAVPERIASNGEVLRPLDEKAAAQVAADVARLGVEAVAICLLHSYVNPVHEERLADIVRAALPEGTTVVTSSSVWPELGEYERATTTLMSAYVGPVMASYLQRLGRRLRELGVTAPVYVMESAGGVLPAVLAASRAVYTIESGPAAGVIAAAREGARRSLADIHSEATNDGAPVGGRSSPHGWGDLISFDMGGTTAKAGLVRGGRPGITHEFQVGGKGSYGGRRPGTGVPIKVPAIDLAEVGSGGGSIAWVESGTLRVGPRSAGADPGPACYGRGGRFPTVTDANLVLGYLAADGFGEFTLSEEKARDAIAEHVARPLDVDVIEAAAAIHDIANAQMGAAVHVVTVRRGIDPRGFTLVALGGAAPTHVARLAERFGITRVLVPPQAGVGSAVGLLHADLAIERAKTFLAPVNHLLSCSESRDALGELAQVFEDLERVALADLETDKADCIRAVGIRFIGQAHAFTIELASGPITPGTLRDATEEFYKRYHESYGIELRDPAELTTARVRAVLPAGSQDPPSSTRPPGSGTAGTRRIWLDGAIHEVPTIARDACAPGDEPSGPCVITEPQCSLLIPPGWHGTVDDHGAIVLERSTA